MLSLKIEVVDNGYLLRKVYEGGGELDVESSVIEVSNSFGNPDEAGPEMDAVVQLLCEVIDKLSLPAGRKHDRFRVVVKIEEQNAE